MNASKHKKSIVYVVVLATLLSFAVACSRRFMPANGDLGKFETVATVNEEPIAYGEFIHDLEANRSSIYAYFHDKYGIEDNAAFWTTAYGDEIPEEKLKKQAMESSVRRKVLQIAAKKYGLVEDISYHKLLLDLQKTNAMRQDKLRRKEVVFGPVAYDEQTYFAESALVLKRNVIEALKSEFQISQQDAADEYEKNKQQFSLGESRTIQSLAVSFTDEQDKARKRGSALAKLESIKNKMDSGIPFDDIYAEFVQHQDEFLQASEKVYEDNAVRTEAIRNPKLIGEIVKLSMGQTTGIVEQEHAIGIYACVEKHALGFSTFEQVKSKILSDLAERKVAEYVDQRVKDAKVEIVEKNMARVKMR